MPYTIRYTAIGKKKFRAKRKNAVSKVALTFLIISVLVCACVLKQHIAPGENSVTAVAIAQMAQNIKDGDSLYEAAEAFCRQILEGAHID